MRDVVRTAQAEFDRAELEGDRQALSRLIADDFKSIGPKGFVLDKRQWIDRHGLFKYQSLETSEVDVRVYGAAAIVRNVQRNRATYEGHAVALTVRVSQVWIAQPDGQWRIVAIQFSPMTDDKRE